MTLLEIGPGSLYEDVGEVRKETATSKGKSWRIKMLATCLLRNRGRQRVVETKRNSS